MPEWLIREAEALGINASLYYLLPPKWRVKALEKDVEKAKKAAKHAAEKGEIHEK